MICRYVYTTTISLVTELDFYTYKEQVKRLCQLHFIVQCPLKIIVLYVCATIINQSPENQVIEMRCYMSAEFETAKCYVSAEFEMVKCYVSAEFETVKCYVSAGFG